MNYKVKKLKIILSSIVVLISLVSCSTYKNLESKNNIVINSIGSNVAKITSAGLYTTEANVILLRGKLKRTIFQSGAIPGHLDIELLNLDGIVFKKAEVRYWQQGGKYSDSTFSIPIPIEPTLVSSIRISHHTFGSHTTIKKSSPWQDVTKVKDMEGK